MKCTGCWGNGNHKCPDCGGRGMKSGWLVGGSYQCKNCGGSGNVKCNGCNGKGWINEKG